MKRRRLLSLLGIAAAVPSARAAEVGSEEYAKKLVQFNHYYGIFYRDYFGCPPHATLAEECTMGSGHTNYDAYLRASRMVKEVFPSA